ncbi:hypothetical protein MRB53_001838 [Persea americana]|uniref:Uncharacterized protein n=1 Tax=Persea americana TaxID=3435 RepID=A0ACC2MTS2_PERAE|nr:hypothetical protein MRB53_001838 [Persea americana]
MAVYVGAKRVTDPLDHRKTGCDSYFLFHLNHGFLENDVRSYTPEETYDMYKEGPDFKSTDTSLLDSTTTAR